VQIMGSEVGVVDIPNWDIASKGRLMPGNIFLVDFDAGRVIKDEEVRLPGVAPHLYDLPFLALSESQGATACLALHCVRVHTAQHLKRLLSKGMSSRPLMEQDCAPCTTCDMLQSFVLMYGWVVQMKEKYTKMRPYGEWLAEQTVILQQIIDAVPEEQRQPPPVLPAGALPSNGAMHVSISNFLILSAQQSLLARRDGTFMSQLVIRLLVVPERLGKDGFLAVSGRQAKLLS